MPHNVARAVVAGWPTIAPVGDLAIANALPRGVPDLIQGREWDTARNLERNIDINTGRTSGAATAAGPAYDTHVADAIEVVVASTRNPVIGAYAGVRHAAYAAMPFGTTPGYGVSPEFADDRARKFFKLPSGTPAEQAQVMAEYGAIQATTTAAVVNTVVGPSVVTDQQAAKQRYYQRERAAHHRFRSVAKTQRFYDAVEQHLMQHTVTRSIGTEMRGEVATVETLIAGQGYELKMAFDGQGHTGIDQIWVRRVNGDITEYRIVEAKGSYNAKLGTAAKGDQMSARWVYVSLMEMVQRGTHAATALKILAAIHGAPYVLVTGCMIKCKYKPLLAGNVNDQHTIIHHTYGDYNIRWV